MSFLKQTAGWIALLVAVSAENGYAQSTTEQPVFSLTTKKNRAERLDVQIIHNLMLVPVRINDADEDLFFVLDTGVSQPLVTSVPNNVEISLNYVEVVRIAGLGGEHWFEAFSSKQNKLQVQRMVGKAEDVLVLKDDIFHLNAYLGTQANGLIGHSLFRDFIVEIDYARGWVKFHSHERFGDRYQAKKSSNNWGVLPLSFRNNKPYVEVMVEQQDGSVRPFTLLIDSGASHALSLYPSANGQITLPKQRLHSLLGTGLSGGVEGYIGRVNSLFLDQFTLSNVITHFPDEDDIQHAIIYSARDGSLGADVLKRFKVMFNYRDSTMILTPSRYFADEFEYNMAGIEVISSIAGNPIYEIAYVRPLSPGAVAGLEAGDFISKIDGTFVSTLAINGVVDYFHGKKAQTIEVEIVRGDSTFVKTLHFIAEL